MKKKMSKEEKVLERNTLKNRKQLLKEYKKATKEPMFNSEEREIIKHITITFIVIMYLMNIFELIANGPFMREAMLIENIFLPFIIGLVVAIAIFFERRFF